MSVQDAVDASEHYEVYNTDDIPSLCTIIVDTNPRAWAALTEVLPISKAIANILIFVNAHLAFSNSNHVAIIAAHTNRAVWLYPTPPKQASAASNDVDMQDATNGNHKAAPNHTPSSANKYPQFAQIENSLLTSLRALIDDTTAPDLSTTTTQISGALTLALAHINKTALSFSASDTATGAATTTGTAMTAGSSVGGAPGTSTSTSGGGLAGLHARILILSVSDSAPAQYIPTMNAVFAAAHARIAIDTLSLRGSATFLEQASFITRGTFIRAAEPRGLLQYLMFGFGSGTAPSNPAGGGGADSGKGPAKSKSAVSAASGGGSGAGTGTGGGGAAGKPKTAAGKLGLGASVAELLVTPSADAVDFRAACFCHRNVVDTGFVCSICLSIFCEVPDGGACLTCGTQLALGNYGKRPIVAGRGDPAAAAAVGGGGGGGGGGNLLNAPRREKRKAGMNGEV
ncbi:transcription factor Tfb4-domain-containing protein [Chaetomidium leptoderma]|uniref:General transcription and DNA repair factor IIH subunit TFB4 n=1 Tax=Chaetomidium leptoderma TaxID=669021 RepID=A0AAN6ZT91_9PEZI|nr:transcription factor Tfb4-domain-containing protein [Chaetomidium leptoderma]